MPANPNDRKPAPTPRPGPPPSKGPEPTFFERLRGRRESDIHLPSHPADRDKTIDQRRNDPVEGLRNVYRTLRGSDK